MNIFLKSRNECKYIFEKRTCLTLKQSLFNFKLFMSSSMHGENQTTSCLIRSNWDDSSRGMSIPNKSSPPKHRRRLDITRRPMLFISIELIGIILYGAIPLSKSPFLTSGYTSQPKRSLVIIVFCQ